jgi:hypothetical protein
MPLVSTTVTSSSGSDLSDPVAGWSEVSGKKGLLVSAPIKGMRRDSHVPTVMDLIRDHPSSDPLP